MTIYDYINRFGDNKPFHSYEFADATRARRIGSNGFKPFKKRQRQELNRRVIRGYTDSKIVRVPEARQELAVAQREETKQRFEKLQAQREQQRILPKPERPLPSSKLK